MLTKEKNVKLFRTMFLAVAMIMMFAVPVQAQASAKSTYEKAVNYYKDGKFKKAKTEFKKLPKKASEKCVKKMPKKMKSAYLKVVNKYAKKNNSFAGDYLWGYYLTDINKDGKAELLIKFGGSEADVKTTVYRYKSGKAKKVGSFDSGHSSFYYDPRGNGMTVVWGNMAYEHIYTQKMKSGKLKTVSWGEERSVTTSSGGANYMYIPYQLDDHVKSSGNGYYSYDLSPLK